MHIDEDTIGEGAQGCSVFGRCGGCTLLDIDYAKQLADKDWQIAELFKGLCEPSAIRPIIGMNHPYHYRDKVIAPFAPANRDARRGNGNAGLKGTDDLNSKDEGSGRGRHSKHKAKGKDRRKRPSNPAAIKSGMYARGSHTIVESPDTGCLLENERAAKIIDAIKSTMAKGAIPAYDEDAHTGFMRHAIMHFGHTSDELLVTLVTNSDEFPHSKWFCRELVRRVPEITSIVQSVNMRQTNVVLGDRERTLYGPGFILDKICGLSFRISASSFYQVNSTQTEVLYDAATSLAGSLTGASILDAYCGTGTIGLVAASRGANKLVGIDNVASSIRDARQNAKHNGIECARFICDDATEWLCNSAGGAFDVAFIDPPRAGSTPEFLTALASIAPRKIVYISCNPKTQARDLSVLLEHRYRVTAIQPIDMFPHTPHIESIAVLTSQH